MWYNYFPPEITEDEINADIGAALEAETGADGYQFVWYENPKMTVPDVYHVQVFWRRRQGDQNEVAS